MATPTGTGTNLVKYGKYSLEAAEREEAALPMMGADVMKLGVGRNVVRFLPPPIGKDSPFRIAHQHFIDTPAGRVTFTCPRMEAKLKCPACSKYETLARSGNPVDKNAADSWKPKMRVFANVIDRKNPEAGPKVLGFGAGVMKDLNAIRKDEDVGGDFTDPDAGFDIVIEREGTGKNDTKYKVFPMRKASSLGNPAWLEAQHDLEKFSRVRGPEELERMLWGEAGDKPADGQPPADGKPPVGRAASKSKRTADDDVVEEGAEDDISF